MSPLGNNATKAKKSDKPNLSMESVSSEDAEIDFSPKPFFDKQNAKEFYSDEESPPSPKTKSSLLKNFFFTAVLLSLVVIVAVTTSLFIQKPFENDSDNIMSHMNKLMNSFKSDLRKEREIMLSKTNVNTDFKKAFDTFTRQSNANFVKKAEFRLKIDALQSSLKELQKKGENRSSQEDSTALKTRLNTLEKEFGTLRDSINGLESQQMKHVEDIKAQPGREEHDKGVRRLDEMDRRLKSVIESQQILTADAKRFVTEDQLNRRVKAMASQRDLEGFHEAFSANRDGGEVNWANFHSGAFVSKIGNRYNPLMMMFSPVSKNTLLTPISNPGDCVAFKQRGGYVLVVLRSGVSPVSFTYETVFPKANPSKGSGPKRVRVSGITAGNTVVPLNPPRGYFLLKADETWQKMEVAKTTEKIEKIRFDFDENHGHEHYTCVYRIQVQGRE